jgi:hypothetical protein
LLDFIRRSNDGTANVIRTVGHKLAACVIRCGLQDAQAAAQTLGKRLVVVNAGREGELEAAFSTLIRVAV